MAEQHLSRAAMARQLDLTIPVFCKYMDGRHKDCQPRRVEAVTKAFFKRTELVQRQRTKDYIQLRTSALVMERCEEARAKKELVVLYGPPGISKTFSLREYVRRRADADDDGILLVTANSVTTPKALLESLCSLLGFPARKAAHVLVERVIDSLNAHPQLVIVDEANHLDVRSLELLRHIHDMTECGMVLVGTKRLYEVFTNGGRKSQDLEQLWSRVGIHDLLPGLSTGEVRQITRSSLGHSTESTLAEIERTTRGSARRLMKLIPRLKCLKELNRDKPTEKLVPIAAGQIIV